MYAWKRQAQVEISPLRANLSVSVDDVFGGGQFPQTHGASGMKFLGADADLRPESKLCSVGKTGGGIHIYGGRVHRVQKVLGFEIVPCDDGLGMAGSMLVDEGNGLLQVCYCSHGQDIVVILLSLIHI